MSRLVLGMDSGNYKGKIVGQYGTEIFRTALCEWFERDVSETFGVDDMEFDIGGRKGFCGSIAVYENEFDTGGTFGETKAHEDNKIRILLGIYRYMKKYNCWSDHVCLVTGQPIARHKENEKQDIINLIEGSHKFKVNGDVVEFAVEGVRVAPEGSGAFWSHAVDGLVRIVDVGSGTVNLATIHDKHHIHKGSGTINTGMETLRSDVTGLARAVYQQGTKLKWKRDDMVYLCGGATNKLLVPLREYFSNIQTLDPKLKMGVQTVVLSPVYANAVGFYHLARGVYGE